MHRKPLQIKSNDKIFDGWSPKNNECRPSLLRAVVYKIHTPFEQKINHFDKSQPATATKSRGMDTSEYSELNE